MLNPQLLKLMIEMQGSEDYEEQEEKDDISGGSGRKFIEFGKRKLVTVPVHYDD